MVVAFNAIPGNNLVPFFYAEINSGGTPYEGQSRLLLLGQETSAGTAPVNVPVGPIQSEAEAISYFGVGSMLVSMFNKARNAAPFQPIWALPLADPAGTAATCTITVNTAPLAAGVATFGFLGFQVSIQVNAADTTTQIATTIRDNINALNIPITATSSAGVVTVTSRHTGATNNGIEVLLLTGISGLPNILAGRVTITAMAGGAGVPALATGLAALGDEEFDWICGPYSDTTSLNSIRDFLSDVGTGRWSPLKQTYGHYITASYGSLGTLVALGNGRNDRHTSIIGSQTRPNPLWDVAAAVGGITAEHLTDAPELSRPLQTLRVPGILPPRDKSLWFDTTSRQALYVDGIGALKNLADGTVVIDRLVTTEQLNSAGVPDGTFRDIETAGQVMYLTRYFKVAVSNNHSRQALANDNPSGLQSIATPRSVRNTLCHAARELQALGVVESADEFAARVVVERDLNNATRLNAYIPVDVVNQLRVFAANITVFLEYQKQAQEAA
jgi:phage tail sheath gpL-like